MSAQVAVDLRAAADVLERDGWTQGKYHSLDGCHCALGALAVVVSGRGARPNPDRWVPGGEKLIRFLLDAHALYEAVDRPTTWPRADTAQWNDTPGRTAEEVIAALRAAADRAEAETDA